MKNIKATLLGLAVAVCGLFAFNNFQAGSIKGTINPPDAAKEVWAVSATDTLKAPVNNGAFEITNAKAGTYKVMVDATDPYKDAVKDGVQVSDGQATDVGEIKLEK